MSEERVAAERIGSGRLWLEPLRVGDAAEMVGVLGDPRLHEFIGGRPASLDELRQRYRRLTKGSPHEDQVWLNWVARRREDGRAVGTVQATLTNDGDTWTAEVAWVVGVEHQGQGFAAEAARALVAWLRHNGVTSVEAHIHPDHEASATVAARAGLRPTDEEADGERVWRTLRHP